MPKISFDSPPGATPIDDISQLLPIHITTHQELFELEYRNITDATRLFLVHRPPQRLTIQVLLDIHHAMFNQVWEWAGKLRKTVLNLGSKPENIMLDLATLLNDFNFWQTCPDIPFTETAARLHHRLVQIHPFVNGNGRWARLVTNVYYRQSKRKYLYWNESALNQTSDIRKTYLHALKEADNHNFTPLIVLQTELETRP